MRPALLSLKNIGILAAIPFLVIACNAGNQTDELEFDLTGQDIMVVLPPGYPAVMEGTTLVVTGYASAPIVHSYPAFAGVDTEGDIGIGSAAGYDNGDYFTVPINANLGAQLLHSYKVCITIAPTGYLRGPTSISGSKKLLSDSYPTRYKRAAGFEAAPTIQPSPLCFSATSTSTDATGTVNLAELEFYILQQLPPNGVSLDFQVLELKDADGNDLCVNFNAAGCSDLGLDGIVVSNFHIQTP